MAETSKDAPKSILLSFSVGLSRRPIVAGTVIAILVLSIPVWLLVPRQDGFEQQQAQIEATQALLARTQVQIVNDNLRGCLRDNAVAQETNAVRESLLAVLAVTVRDSTLSRRQAMIFKRQLRRLDEVREAVDCHARFGDIPPELRTIAE